MSIEGRLEIRLATDGDAVKTGEIRSRRPVFASWVILGKGVAESQEMLPLLFSVCAAAQSCAGARACEQALGGCLHPRPWSVCASYWCTWRRYASTCGASCSTGRPQSPASRTGKDAWYRWIKATRQLAVIGS